MNRPRKLAAHLASALAVATLFGTSAFAESRHHERTAGQAQAESQQRQQQTEGRIRRDGGSPQQPSAQQERPAGGDRSVSVGDRYPNGSADRGNAFDRSQSGQQSPRNIDRSQNADRSRSYDRRDGSSSNGNWRGNDGRGTVDNRGNRGSDNRDRVGSYGRNDTRSQGGWNRSGSDNRGGYGNRGGYNNGGMYDGRNRMVGEGRISRMNRERGGYRVWLDRGGYSYWIPEARFSLFPLRVGLSIRFGGYWDPLGYYNVYDVGPMGGPFYTSGDLHGVVENVDYRRGTLVLRDDLSGSFVTVTLRGNDPRLGDLRPGDYVDLSGAWARGGYFEAYRLDNIRGNDGYDRYGDSRY